MLDRLDEQERIISETSKLEGWKEVSSFLFHQLRTPLSSIELASRNVRLAAVTGSASPALEACASSAETALAELLRIRILLERFKNLSGLALSAPAPLDPAELVASIAARIAPDRARIRFEGAGNPLLVDRRMTEEALLNLVINAAEACPEPPALVSIAASLAGDFAQLEISDANGPVDPGLFARSGRERFTTKPEGTGLGLLFVRRVVALHGGSFELFPGEDGGFRVKLRLPLAQDHEAERQGEEAADEDTRPGR
ncbi:MAG: ATP-binding protein [Spirochaetota bacterium]